MTNYRILKFTISILTFTFICLHGTSMKAKSDSKDHLNSLAHEGSRLSSDAIEKLENELITDSDDLTARAKLIGYYSRKQFTSEDSREKLEEHILWSILNHPDGEIARLHYSNLDPRTNGKAYKKAKKLWLKQVDTDEANIAILSNAAQFFLLHDTDIAESLLKKGKDLEPNNPHWPERLSRLYSLGMSGKSGKSKKIAAQKSLEQQEHAFKLTADERQKYYMLTHLAEISFEAGDLDKASKYATDLLKKSTLYPKDWNNGNAVHHGNLVLGRVALALGKLEKSKEYLLKAGKTSGSPQLNSFGPNMSLAKELIEKNEREIVIEYFQLCGNFWAMDRGCLKEWEATVMKGDMPDFGPSLTY